MFAETLADIAPELATLLRGIDEDALTADLVVLFHLLTMATGLGTAVFAFASLMWRARRLVDPAHVADLENSHRLVARSLAGLWLSGLWLLVIRTEMDPTRLTPALVSKVLTVSLLTIVGVAIASHVLPLLQRSVGGHLATLSLPRKVRLGLIAGLWVGGWTAALALGGAETLQGADGSAAFQVMVLAHVLGLVAGVATALVWHLRYSLAAWRGADFIPAE